MDTLGDKQSKDLSLSGAEAPRAAVVARAVRSAAVAGPLEGSSVSGGVGAVSEQQPRLYVRRFVAEWDYALFAGWLRAHGREVLPAWALPFVGFVACFRGAASLPVAMAFGYQDGRVGLVTWLTAAPGLSPRLALGACSLVVGAVERELEARGVRLMISPTERPSLVKFMRRRGWRVAHEANVLLWRNVDEAKGGAR